MSLFLSSLNSGSNGNCYYVGTQEKGILIDGGLSRKETEKRLKKLGLSIRSIRAIFVSHEHGDHIHGIPSIAKKYNIPIYITDNTLRHAGIELAPEKVRRFEAHVPVVVDDLSVTAFPKFHDAVDPHSFIVSNESVTVGVFTDIGAACDNVKQYFSRCHAVFLESNYDDDMLDRGGYPYFLKERIRGDRGHLSNAQALQLFLTSRSPYLSHLFLSHLSRDNNSPRLVKELFSQVAGTTQVIVASRDRQSPLYHIRNTLPKLPVRRVTRTEVSSQISLWS